MRYIWLPIVLLYALVASRNITLPGLYYDELLQNVPALAFVKGDIPSDTNWIEESEVSISGHRFPLMTQEYIGSVKTAAFAPVAAAAGVGPRSVRYFSITVAALALIAAFAFARRLFGPLTASVAMLLIGLDPSFIAFTRVDYGPSTVMLLTKTTALWLLSVWWRSGRLRHLAAACLMLGLGTYDKANFVWIVAATVVAGVVVAQGAFLRRLSVGSVLSAASGFCVGAAPFIWFNIKYPLATFYQLDIPYIADREPGVTLMERIWARGATLCRLLNGDAFTGWVGQPPATVPVLPLLLLAAIVIVGVHATRTGGWRAHRAFAFVLLSAALTLLFSALTRGGGEVHHVILVYPLPHILIACGVALIATKAGDLWAGHASVTRAAVAAGMVAAAVMPGLAHYQGAIETVKRTGGWGIWSVSIYDLNDYLMQTAQGKDIVAIDWGIHHPLVGLSQGVLHSIDLQDPLRDLTPEAAVDVLQEHFDQPDTRYVLHAPGATVFQNARTNLVAAAKATNRALTLERTISGRDGGPVFEIYRAGAPLGPEMASLAGMPRPAALAGSTGAAIVAVPNPVPAGDGSGRTLVTWDTGDQSEGQVYFEVTWPGGGQTERLWVEGASGAQSASWINAGATYHFRLYAGTDHKTVLSTVAVTRDQSTGVKAP